MNDEQVRLYFQAIQKRIFALQSEKEGAWEELHRTLDELHVLYEEILTNLEVAKVSEEELLLKNQRIIASYYYYYDLFQASPIAYLVTDTSGVILEANQAIAELLNVPQSYLLGKPLAVYVAPGDRSAFYTKLSRLSKGGDRQMWQMTLHPRKSQPFMAEFNLAIVRNQTGEMETVRIGIYNLSQHQAIATEPTPLLTEEATPDRVETDVPPLPPSLDGLQVLVVDDEADARDFITAVLESRGIRVTAVASAAEALKTLEKFHPDVLVCDIRMPDIDGYTLIQQIRTLEAKQGRHTPAGAFTAYLDENREKALKAGFEAHLHKLAKPDEVIEMVVQLARQTPTS